jgi:hypothetical protein
LAATIAPPQRASWICDQQTRAAAQKETAKPQSSTPQAQENKKTTQTQPASGNTPRPAHDALKVLLRGILL